MLQVYRRERQIPRDSFIARSNNLRQQFWPVGASTAGSGIVLAPAQPVQPQETAEAAPQPAPEPADETPAQARRSEQRLTRDERKDLQIALKAGGFYASAIDGAFGRGTRRSMADWQAAFGHEETGVLTTRQRQQLMDQYNAPLISVGMRRITDDQAGIALQIPSGEVAFFPVRAAFCPLPVLG